MGRGTALDDRNTLLFLFSPSFLLKSWCARIPDGVCVCVQNLSIYVFFACPTPFVHLCSEKLFLETAFAPKLRSAPQAQRRKPLLPLVLVVTAFMAANMVDKRLCWT